jgi:hypothetical protein
VAVTVKDDGGMCQVRGSSATREWFGGLGLKTIGGRFSGLGPKTQVRFRQELEAARGIIARRS